MVRKDRFLERADDICALLRELVVCSSFPAYYAKRLQEAAKKSWEILQAVSVTHES